MVVGAGTVLTANDVRAVADSGGRIIVAPNSQQDVGLASIEMGLSWCPGVTTPTEAFAALENGAAMLKIFPAEMVPPKALAAMRSVLPKDALVVPVGGIAPEMIDSYRQSGADGFGLGSALFKPTYSLTNIASRAQAFARAWEA
jgi:2-dehydro-3-deoxyphosphogalactonate aldolase